MALSMKQQMAIRDANERIRCPICGKYSKETDFPSQQIHEPIGDGKAIIGHIHLLPSCKKCLGW